MASNRFRRPIVAVVLPVIALGVVAGVMWWPSKAVPSAHPTTPATALAELLAGNQRYVHSRRTHSTDTRHDADDRHELANGQHPFAALLCCSDSRICPEFVFDQRPGCLFEIRNAGNLVDDDVMASFEYAVEHLHVPVIVILGHKRCGAIEAVQEADGKPLHDHLREIQRHMDALKDAIHAAHEHPTPEVLDQLSRKNALLQRTILLEQSRPVRDAYQQGRVGIAVMMYDLESGRIEILSDG